MKVKACICCGDEKPLSEFYRCPRMADGHVNKCKGCFSLYASRRLNGPMREVILERARARARRRPYSSLTEEQKAHKRLIARKSYKVNREVVLARVKRYRNEHPEVRRKYQTANRERRRLTHARWRLQNPERLRAASMRRKSYRKLLPDGYIKNLISSSTGISRRFITDEMVEERREIVSLNRKLRKLRGRLDYGQKFVS